MVLRKAVAREETQNYLSYTEKQGGAEWLGGVTEEKLLY